MLLPTSFLWLDSPRWARVSRPCRVFTITPHLVELLWTSDEHVAVTSTWQHTTLTTDRLQCHRRNPSKRETAGPHFDLAANWNL